MDFNKRAFELSWLFYLAPKPGSQTPLVVFFVSCCWLRLGDVFYLGRGQVLPQVALRPL
jgi:hypothetical protein